MLFCYVDESGNTGNNLNDPLQPFLILTALIVPPECIKAIEDDLRLLGYKYFAAESRNTDFEFHGDEIYNARGRYFKKLSLDKRIEILDNLIDIVIKHESIKIGYVSMEKKKYFGRLHVQQAAFHLLIEKLEERLKGSLDSHCLLIADEQDDLEQKLIDDLDHFKQHGTTFGYKSVNIERIIDSVHFVQSHNNHLMQLTDVICYILRKGKEAGEKLLIGYADYQKLNPKIEFLDWKEKFGNKGQVYFYNSYYRLNGKKPWLFAKCFPT